MMEIRFCCRLGSGLDWYMTSMMLRRVICILFTLSYSISSFSMYINRFSQVTSCLVMLLANSVSKLDGWMARYFCSKITRCYNKLPDGVPEWGYLSCCAASSNCGNQSGGGWAAIWIFANFVSTSALTVFIPLFFSSLYNGHKTIMLSINVTELTSKIVYMYNLFSHLSYLFLYPCFLSRSPLLNFSGALYSVPSIFFKANSSNVKYFSTLPRI